MTKNNSKIENSSQDSPLLNLPDEIKLHIMSFLGRKALVRTGRVCKELHNLSNDKSIEKVPDYRLVNNDPELLFQNVLTTAKSMDGRYIAVLTCDIKNNFSLWDVESQKIIFQITINHYFNASSIKLAMTPDNKHLIINYYKIFNPFEAVHNRSSFSYIDIWDLEKKQQIGNHENITNYSGAFLDLPYPHVEVISNDKFLVTLLGYNYTRDVQSIYLCNITNKEIEMLDGKTPDSEYKSGVYGTACISPDKKVLARVANSDIDIHNAKTGQKIKSLVLPKMLESISSMQMEFLSDNQTICIIGSEYVAPQAPVNPNKPRSYLMKINYVTGVRERLNIEVPPNHRAIVNSFTLLPNNHVAIINKYDENLSLGNEILIYDLSSQKLIKTINTPVKSILSNTDGSQMYIIDGKDQLGKVNVPMVARELDSEPEQVASTVMRI